MLIPTGEAYPCCHAEMGVGQVGNCKNNTMAEIWNSPEQKKLVLDMLTEQHNPACGRCYEQEKAASLVDDKVQTNTTDIMLLVRLIHKQMAHTKTLK
jgi:MoaA/NifB/PqqE/SkfB family radical SAM enzyme